MIRVFDSFGRERFISREDWRKTVLPDALRGAGDEPDRLASLIIQSLRDGFAADLVEAALRLERIDPNAERAATLLGLVYLDSGRLDDARRTLEQFVEAHGESGVVLTNLAKVHSAQGDQKRAGAVLWRALEVDPNQDNGLGWYVALQRESGGEPAGREALSRVAALPGSYRAQLWLAKAAIADGDLARALVLYGECLARAPRPVPADVLMQLTGDLGRAGKLPELLELAGPLFDAKVHELAVGNNLLKANLDLGRVDAAKGILDQLYALQRPDWRESLDFWATELARKRVGAAPASAPLSVELITIEGPLWMREGSTFAALRPAKAPGAARVLFFGCTALQPAPPDQATSQLSEGRGRLSRAIPLALCERVHFATAAAGTAAILLARGQGFVVMSKAYEDKELAELARKADPGAGHVVAAVVDARAERWGLEARVLRISDGSCVASAREEATADDPGPAVDALAARVEEWALAEAGPPAAPSGWSRPPEGPAVSSQRLLALEQLLAVTIQERSGEQGFLYGEHSILEHALQLAVDHPESAVLRSLFAELLRRMQRVRPEIVKEFQARTELLQRQHPVAGELSRPIADAIAAVYPS